MIFFKKIIGDHSLGWSTWWQWLCWFDDDYDTVCLYEDDDYDNYDNDNEDDPQAEQHRDLTPGRHCGQGSLVFVIVIMMLVMLIDNKRNENMSIMVDNIDILQKFINTIWDQLIKVDQD